MRDYCSRFFVDEADGIFVDLENIMEIGSNSGEWDIMYRGAGKWSKLSYRRGQKVFATLLAYRKENT